MGYIVVTQPKGDKHVMSDSTIEFWETHNSRNHPEFHVKIKEFQGDDAEKKAIAFAQSKESDYVPVDKNSLAKVTAKIKEEANAAADLKVKEVEKKAQDTIKEQDAKMKKLQEKIDKLEAEKSKEKK